MRRIPVVALLVLVGASLMPPASAQGKVTVPTDTSVEVSIKKGRFSGTLKVPGNFDAPGNLDPETCLEDRDIEIFRKRSGSDRKIGTATTDGDGTWQLRGKVAVGSYYLTVAESRFAYSPGYGYGETEEAICERLVGTFRVATGSRVLGARFTSGDKVLGTRVRAGQLPFTGMPVWTWSLVATGMLAAGAALLKLSSTKRSATG